MALKLNIKGRVTFTVVGFTILTTNKEREMCPVNTTSMLRFV